jgi:two-component system, sensor histidine kinase and response regulator
VAHDLRTPLQAFLSELELLQGNIVSERSAKRNFLLSSIEQLERICDFMNMTINRSIDFTKASSGIKLNPSIESINFSETLKWAVGCMAKSHVNVPIVMSPIPKSIHNQIFTDKQWLMENILCLLSNAQKFTTEGEIVIRCSLHTSSKDTTGARRIMFPNIEISSDLNGDIEAGTFDVRSQEEEEEEAAPMLLLEVEDTGIGISKENRERLFKPFAQVSEHIHPAYRMRCK